MSALELHVAIPEQGHTSHQDQMAALELHTEDLENQSRRNNLRHRGLLEATGTENLTVTITAILNKVLEAGPPNNLEFDRVHRALGPKPTDPDRPRDVICRLHHYTQKEQVLGNAWSKGPIDFDGARIASLPDVSRGTLQRTAMLKPLLEKLRHRKLTGGVSPCS